MSDRSKSELVCDLGEEELVSRLVAGLPTVSGLLTGPGDDCAVIQSAVAGEELLLFKTDSVVEGVHFEAETDPSLVGRKAICRAISDMAAMGGRPTFCLVTLALDKFREVEEIEGWYRGIRAAAKEYDCMIAGGETTCLPKRGAVISIAMLGVCGRDHCIRRSGGKVGDWIAVTGRLGGSFQSGRHLTFSPRVDEGAWLAKSGFVTAMMDLSDGLGSDLPRLAESSGTGYNLDLESLPRHEHASVEGAITDGEDYELLITVAPEGWKELEAEWRRHFPGCDLTRIGKLAETTEEGLPSGWEHYKEEE